MSLKTKSFNMIINHDHSNLDLSSNLDRSSNLRQLDSHNNIHHTSQNTSQASQYSKDTVQNNTPEVVHKEVRLHRHKIVGKGTFGIVYLANFESPSEALYFTQRNDAQQVAVKQHMVDKAASFSVPVRELTILQQFRDHPFIVQLLTVSFGNPFISKSYTGQAPNDRYNSQIDESILRKDELHFVFEKATSDVHEMIYRNNIDYNTKKLSMVQMLLAMEYLHNHKVVHRDLKPTNVLWFRDSHKSTVKFADFGLSKYNTNQEPMTPRTVTAWYRAPEIICRWNNYGCPIDVWSIGCILVEMVISRALFRGTEDRSDKILPQMIRILPEGTIEELRKVDINNLFTPILQKTPPFRSPKDWREVLNLSRKEVTDFNQGLTKQGTYTQFLDLLKMLLTIDPKKRFTASQALDHTFFNGFRSLIKNTRKIYFPISQIEQPIQIICRPERLKAVRIACNLFNKRCEKEYSWYTHRILFQSLDIFDRYLEWMEKTQSESEAPKTHLSEADSELKFMVCVYLSMKLFTTCRIYISFEDIVSPEYRTEYYLKIAESFERELIQRILKYKLYRNTVFEAADELGLVLHEIQIRDLLLAHGDTDSIQDTPINLIKKYLKLDVSQKSNEKYLKLKYRYNSGDGNSNNVNDKVSQTPHNNKSEVFYQPQMNIPKVSNILPPNEYVSSSQESSDSSDSSESTNKNISDNVDQNISNKSSDNRETRLPKITPCYKNNNIITNKNIPQKINSKMSIVSTTYNNSSKMKISTHKIITLPKLVTNPRSLLQSINNSSKNVFTQQNIPTPVKEYINHIPIQPNNLSNNYPPPIIRQTKPTFGNRRIRIDHPGINRVIT